MTDLQRELQRRDLRYQAQLRRSFTLTPLASAPAVQAPLLSLPERVAPPAPADPRQLPLPLAAFRRG